MKEIVIESDELMNDFRKSHEHIILFEQKVNGKWFVKYMDLIHDN